jgi:hypothetical protein
MLLFTTDRTVVAKDVAGTGMGVSSLRHRKKFYEYLSAQQQSLDDRPVETTTQKIAKILSENEENHTIPHSAITQLRVKLPRAWCVWGE